MFEHLSSKTAPAGTAFNAWVHSPGEAAARQRRQLSAIVKEMAAYQEPDPNVPADIKRCGGLLRALRLNAVKIGSRVFDFHELIGFGSQGVVARATMFDRCGAAKPVAVKLFEPSACLSSGIRAETVFRHSEGFERELRALRQLNGKNLAVPTLLQAARIVEPKLSAEAGVLVMDLIEGPSLRDWINNVWSDPLKSGQSALCWKLTILTAAAIGRARIDHGELSDYNMKVRLDPVTGLPLQVVAVDFGRSKLHGDGRSLESRQRHAVSSLVDYSPSFVLSSRLTVRCVPNHPALRAEMNAIRKQIKAYLVRAQSLEETASRLDAVYREYSSQRRSD